MDKSPKKMPKTKKVTPAKPLTGDAEEDNSAKTQPMSGSRQKIKKGEPRPLR